MTRPRALRRPPRRAPRLATAVLAAAAALTVALPAPALAIPALAATEPSPTPTPTSSIAPGTTVFTLSPVSNGIVRAGDALTVWVSLQNGTDVELPATDVTLSLGRTPIATRNDLRDWLGGDVEGAAVAPVAVEPLPAVQPGGSEEGAVTIAGDDPALAGLTPGVYPLAASYSSDTGLVTSTSALVVPDDAREPVAVGVVVPITAGPRIEGLLTSDELAELTAPDGTLTSQLRAVTGTNAILAVDPAIPASIRVLGTAAPQPALEWLSQLEALPNSRFALQFGDADVTAQLQSGLRRPLAPTSFTYAMSPSDFAATTPSPEPTPTPAPTPSATTAPDDELPSTAELLDIGAVGDDAFYWPADGTADADIVTALGGLGTDEGPALTVIPSATTRTGSAGGTVAAHARLGDAQVLVYDSDVSTELQEGSSIDQTWLRGAPLTAATAYLAFATAESSGPLMVTVGRGEDRSRLGLGTAISAAASAPSVEPRTLAALTASDAGTTELVDIDASPERAAAASALVADEEELGRFATILDDPALLTGRERAGILQVLGVGWVGDPEWPTALADHRAATSTTLGSVSLLPTTPTNLFGSRAPLQFWVRNDLPYPVNLVLYTTPDSLRLDVQSETNVIATPQSNTRVDVPVQARVGRGEVTLTLQLRSPVFVAIGEPETVDINVWADWEGVGITALAVVVGSLVVVGVVRTVLRMRRRRHPVDAATPADGTAEDAAAEAEEEPADAASTPSAEADGAAADGAAADGAEK
ncbi:hypothetical protein IF188_17440 [Microbacterium sp. NEAU-LLC]|uniref:2-oxoglutarate dehydrogenase n=1 Tax=Microbacterium helvum TaxID=2773713 RepID=A0ABR8NS63_9MICO|nr:DUF6049 family protein [Microbacterium helvum]MBD3943479.1 hypothetical protein [Microbacterium helvum]